ncbi:hypothetical protein [Desertivirga arenae]|uniref:hypothetical protein n=1 Tax=Desertivirga arenae TaxID=2810309 RepID=UPI001A96509A|nr:hypothetical protein [Pedobacter sp. SYSU D00823]
MKFICASLFVLASSLSVVAQTTQKTKTDTVNNDKISVFSAGASYGNTANYYGQTTALKLPYVSTDLSYQSKVGFYVAGSAIKLVDLGPAVSEVDFAVGYSKDITRRLGASASYTRFFFAKDSPLPQSVNPNTASLGLTYDLKWFNSALNADYVFGNVKDDQGRSMNDLYLSLNNSKEIDLGSIVKDRDFITLSPSLSFIGGTQLVGGEQIITQNPEPGGIPVPGLGKGKDKVRLPVGKPGRNNTQSSSTSVQSTNFALITSNIRLPLAYNRAHYTVEAAYQLSIPNKNFEGIVHENQSFFTLSFTYLFYKDK